MSDNTNNSSNEGKRERLLPELRSSLSESQNKTLTELLQRLPFIFQQEQEYCASGIEPVTWVVTSRQEMEELYTTGEMSVIKQLERGE